MEWNETTENALRELWEKGINFNEIARHFNVTRNTIVGKAHRLGMKGSKGAHHYQPRPGDKRVRKERHVTPRPSPAKATKPKFVAKPIPQSPRGMMPRSPQKPTLVKLPEFAHINGPVSIMDLESYHCHWPMWDDRRQQDQRFYCGQVRIEQSQYCLHHWDRSLSKGEVGG